MEQALHGHEGSMPLHLLRQRAEQHQGRTGASPALRMAFVGSLSGFGGSLMTPASFLTSIEWGGDFVMAVLALGVAVALVGVGFRWPSWKVLLLVAAACALPVLAFDALWLSGLIDYCEATPANPDPCDPGPIPASLSLTFLPFVLLLVAAGIAMGARRRV
jgi:hypothetical protein